MLGQNGNVNREIETVKENQTDIVELRNTIIESIYSLEGFNSSINQTEERIRQFKVRSLEIIESIIQ